ncbi:hypothetical protein MEZE111188_17120 [Mesobacillus zeae]
MWISEKKNGNTAYPHVDRLCVSSDKLFTLSPNAIVHGYPSAASGAVNRSQAALKSFHAHG